MKYKKDYYKNLGVKPDAPHAEIREAYRRLATLNHPDKNPTAQATSQMQEINEAFSVIGNKAKRMKYDLEYANLSSSNRDVPAVRESKQSITKERKAGQNVNSTLLILSFLVALTGILTVRGILVPEPTHKVNPDVISVPIVPPAIQPHVMTATPGGSSALVCATYYQVSPLSGFYQGFWTNAADVTSSRRACSTWAVAAISDKNYCNQVHATFMVIVLMDKSHHFTELPEDLNYETEYLTKVKCST